MKTPDMPCYRRPKKRSWEDHVPTGYFNNKTFFSLQCDSSHLSLRKQAYQNCLRGRPVHLYGDSTLRFWFFYIKQILNITSEGWEVLKRWQIPIYAEDKAFNISLMWAPHELPLYGPGVSVNKIRSIASRLASFPAGSGGIVVLHWYMHTARIPPKPYRERVRNARIAVDDLLRRAPNINVFIKGPHAIMSKYKTVPHDFAKRIYEQIVYEEFAPIRDKVTYLEQWDSSVSSENRNVHPETWMNAAMVHHLLSHVCTNFSDDQ